MTEWSNTLQELRSVLPVDSQTNAIQVCHEYFLDFIGDSSHSGDFWTDPKELDRMMAEKCLKIMSSGLKFNICNLKSSYCSNSDAKDLNVDENIPQELQYSCIHWLDHLSKCARPLLSQKPFRGMLRNLLCRETSLYWLEVMSLLAEFRKAVIILRKISEILKVLDDEDRLYAFSNDLYRFVLAYYEPMMASTPHIYISALVWVPSESLIAKSIGAAFNSQACLLRGGDEHWPTHIQKLFLPSQVVCVTSSPDGHFIASGCSDGTIWILDGETGAPIGEPLRGHNGPVFSVRYSPDGRRIVSGSSDRTVRIWDGETGAPVGKPLQGHGSQVFFVAYSPDGRKILSGAGNGTMRLWNSKTGALVAERKGSFSCANFSPDGSRIALGYMDGTIRISSTETGATVGEPFRGHESSVLCVTYSSDGRQFVSSSFDSTIRIWDAETGASVGNPFRRRKDSSLIISGAEVRQIYETALRSMSYSLDGRRIVSGSVEGAIWIWDAETSARVADQPLGRGTYLVLFVKYSPDGRRVMFGTEEGAVEVWDAETSVPVGKAFEGHEGAVYCVKYSPDGCRIVSGCSEGTIRIWDSETGAPYGERIQGHEGMVQSVTYSPDGRRIVSGSSDKTIRIWDAETGAPYGEPLRGHEGRVLSVSHSPDGRRIVSGSGDKTIRIWDAETGTTVVDPLRGHKKEVWTVTYSPDGRRIVSGSEDGTIRIWDAEIGATVVGPIRGPKCPVQTVTYSPDGRRIVSVSGGKNIQFWDSETGVPIGELLQGHLADVTSVDFSPDGRRIVSGSADDTIRIWEAQTDASHVTSPTDRSSCPQRVPPDGWIRNADGGLLLWVPHDHRRSVCDMSLMSLSDIGPMRPVRVDWKSLCYGTHWPTVKIGVSQSDVQVASSRD